MSDKIIANKDPILENLTKLPETPAPKEIPTSDVKLKRVARPLRHIRHIPVKALVFHSKNGPVEFSYEKKLNPPLAKNKLIVEVNYAALNPVDLKIKNGYSSAIYGEAGLGREYSGVIAYVGSDLADKWNQGDEVYGIYFHPHLGNGALQSSLLIEPAVDPILLRPGHINPEVAAGTLYTLGAAYNILDRLERKGFLKNNSNILINGGTSSVGMFAIQLLKNYFDIQNKIVVVTTGSSADKLKKLFPDLEDELFFVDYLKYRGKISKPLIQIIEQGKIPVLEGETDSPTLVDFKQGKFNIVLDFIGGYDILAHSSSIIHKGGAYLTTVGDYVADYRNDTYNQWDNPKANTRKLFGSMLYSYDYTHFYFDPNAKYASKNDWINKCGGFLENGTVRTIVDKTYKWDKAKEALNYLATQRAQGKLVLELEKF